jgi:oligopeptide/dipeptide ABC transporter ATP-binding protein
VTKDVIRHPAHPYTKALLQSIPILGKGRNQKLEPIRGSTPDPYQRPEGCQFRDRCDYAGDQCMVMPGEEQASNGHMVRCWNWREVMNDGK